jgi:hypothetical protein
VKLAYLVEYMARQKEISGATIAKLLRPTKQTPDQQRQIFHQIAAVYGLKIERRPMKVARRG